MRPRQLALMCALCVASQPARASLVEARAPPIQDYFSADWAVGANVTLAYSRNFNRHHEFAYAACESSHCNISLVAADSSRYRSKTCEVLIEQVSSFGTSGISSLHLPDARRRSERVALVWWRRLGHLVGAFVNSINMTNCKTSAAFPVGGMSRSSRPPHVVVYGHPIYSTIVAEADYRVVMTHTFSGGWIRNIYHMGINQTWTGEEQPVEVGASRGFFVLGTDGAPDWRISVMYANVSSGWKWAMADIWGLDDDSSHTYPKSSGAYQKYGLCWKRLDRDSRVHCSQFLPDGRKAVRQVSLRLPEPVDWLAVHNLGEAAMLLVTGQCHGGTCHQFNVARVDGSGLAGAPFHVNTLDAECPAAPRDLSMDVVEDLEKKLVCFHLACLDSFDEDYPGQSPGSVLRYRRNCINRAHVERMFE